jgi:hypothetical protein
MVLVAALTAGETSWAHERLGSAIQHRVGVVAGSRDVDVTIELTFFEVASRHEREHMDADGDGRVSHGEIVRYLREGSPEWDAALAMRLDGRPVALMPLAPPVLDLLGSSQVGPGHHRLTLRWFARRPEALRPGSIIELEERLWPGSDVLPVLEATGQGGFRLEALRQEPAGRGAAPSDITHRLSVRVTEVPPDRTADSKVTIHP